MKIIINIGNMLNMGVLKYLRTIALNLLFLIIIPNWLFPQQSLIFYFAIYIPLFTVISSFIDGDITYTRRFITGNVFKLILKGITFLTLYGLLNQVMNFYVAAIVILVSSLIESIGDMFIYETNK